MKFWSACQPKRGTHPLRIASVGLIADSVTMKYGGFIGHLKGWGIQILQIITTVVSSHSLVGIVATKSHACYLLGDTGWDWVRIPLGLNFSGSAGGVYISGHT